MERYTEKAKEALILAAEAAEETGSRTVGTEHILVGLMKEGTGTAARVLEAGDVKLERVLELEKKLVSSSQPTQIRDREGYTPIARKVLENSYREAVRFPCPAHRNGAYPYGNVKADGLCGCAAFKYIKPQYPEALVDLLSRHGRGRSRRP